MNDHLLDNVTVTMEPDGENWTLVGQIPCPRLAYNQLGETYTIYELPEDPTEGELIFLKIAITFANFDMIFSNCKFPLHNEIHCSRL